MKESRVFELNQVTAEQVLEAVTTFLRGEKGMEVQSVATPNGYLIQAAQADTLRTLSGMKLATTVELTVNGTQLNVTLGEGQWADKLGAGAVGLFLLWPPMAKTRWKPARPCSRNTKKCLARAWAQ